jgi:shikimate kinase
VIHLIGPGGGGKSTIGRIIADLLRCPFRDLDRLFEERHGDIDDFIRVRGYAAYVRANVETYRTIESGSAAVFAFSSGFMTYAEGTHPHLSSIRNSIVTHPSTFVLLASLDLEECVKETVRRQRERPLAHHRSDRREEDVIRARFPVYMDLAARKVTTMREPADVAAEIAAFIGT